MKKLYAHSSFTVDRAKLTPAERKAIAEGKRPKIKAKALKAIAAPAGKKLIDHKGRAVG